MCRGATERRLQALHSVSVEQIRFLVPAAHLGLAKVNALSQNLILSLRYLFFVLTRGYLPRAHVGQYGASRASSFVSRLLGCLIDAYMTPSALNEIDMELEYERRLSAIVISLQRQAHTQGPESARSAGNANATSVQAPEDLEPSVVPTALDRPHSRNRFHLVLMTGMLLVALAAGWSAGRYFHRASAPTQELAQGVNIDTVVDQIIKVESNGDPNAKKKRSSATGFGQLLDETWLLLIRDHRPDLVRERTEAEVLDLRRDRSVARAITARFTERHANVLKRRGLPVTPGTL